MFSDAEIAIFQEELEEKLQIINDNILLLEQGQVTPEVIQEIFRAAHTIKGSSAVMGYDKMTELTHEIESLFDEIRTQRMEVTNDLVNTLFEAMDTITELKEEIVGGVSSNVDIGILLEKIKQIKNHTYSAPETRAGETEQISQTYTQQPKTFDESALTMPSIEIDHVLEDVIREAELKGYHGFDMQVLFENDCQMKEIRAFLFFETLGQIGEIINTKPPVEDLQNGLFDNGFSVIIVSRSDIDQIKNLALSIAEIQDVYIQQIDLENSGENTQFAQDNISDLQLEKIDDHLIIEQQEPQYMTQMQSHSTGQAQTINQSEKKAIKTVRVDVEKLDTLMNLVGELVIDRTRLERFVEVFENNYGTGDLVEDILEISSHLGQVTTDLQDEIMKARMLPVAQVFNRFPRMVRDIAHKLDKQINFVIEGKETELDRNVIEVIGDPLIHLLRNSIDHGIEDPLERQRLGKPAQGLLRLKASYMESHIVITVEDDGQGIDVQALKNISLERGLINQEQYERMSDREALSLIFIPGFSSKEEDDVSDISGRGVGMDIVRCQIENINGTVEYSTELGQGTCFTIKLPLTLAIIRALMVEHGGRGYAIPLTNVVETLNYNQTEVKSIRHSEVIIVRGQVYPLKRLGEIFNHTSASNNENMYVVIMGSGDRNFGVVVEKLIGEQEIVIKSLGAYLGQIEGLSGAAILGDGKVSLIVDARSLLRNVGAEEAFPYAAAN